jgi:hypothetical protein
MTESQACPECGAAVPVGRLSCGACGALLASVQGRGPAEPDPMAMEARGFSTPEGPSVPGLGPRPGDDDAPGDEAASEAAAVPGGVVAPSSITPALADITPPPPPMPPLPGAYLPPSAVMRGLPVTPTVPPAATPASALGLRPPMPAPESPAPGGPTAGESPAVEPTRAPVLELPFVIAPGPGPRLVAAGSAVAVVAFVLPWVAGGGVVIGGSFGGGYFATWGLAALGNVLPFLLAWVSLLLAVLPNRVPRHVALGLLPVFLGGILAGYAWTYLTAPFGTSIGIWALAAGALLLAAGGSLVLRHGEGSS